MLGALSFRENISCPATHVSLLHYHFELTPKPNWLRAVVGTQHEPQVLQDDVSVVISLQHPVNFIIEFLISFLETKFCLAPYFTVSLLMERFVLTRLESLLRIYDVFVIMMVMIMMMT